MVPARTHSGGEEIFVIAGSVKIIDADRVVLDAWSWSRRAGAQHAALAALTDVVLWIKRGHLPVEPR